MKIAIITSRYPSENNPYNHMFVHARSLYFINQKDIELTVFVPSKEKSIYFYENVKVVKNSSEHIAKEILSFDIAYLHLLNIYPNKTISGERIYESIIQNKIPCAIYLHGSEVQKYQSRSFDYDFSFKETMKFFYKNFFFIPKIRRYFYDINKLEKSIFLAPSNWMKSNAEMNLGMKFNKYMIIPNGIDINMFVFHELYNNRFKIITIRPLESPKYAVDVAIKIMKHLPSEFTLDIYGKGRLKNEYFKLIKKYNLRDRITIIEKFIDRNDLNNLFSNYGIALMPTRMDAQGVSMCEMMSSGLLTVSSQTTAIPEFVQDMKTGILGDNNNPQSFARKINRVTDNYQLYKNICKNARKSIEKLDMFKTMKKELEVLREING